MVFSRAFRALAFVVFLITVSVPALASANDSDTRTLTLNGLDREYLVYRPSDLSKRKPVPLVIMLHGGYGTDNQAENSYGWDALADKKGFVVAYPDGVRRSWNAGGQCCGRAAQDKVDDLGFITRLIETVIKSENIDPKRVYLTGMSNGAAMSYRYGCEGSYPVAAIGVVSGSFSLPCPGKPRPVSVMEIHGVNDQHIPMTGGIGKHSTIKVSWIPVQDTLDTFRAADECPAPVMSNNGDVHTATSICPMKKEVTLITVDGAGHQWPGSTGRHGLIAHLLPIDPPSDAMEATPVLWSFFQRQTAP